MAHISQWPRGPRLEPLILYYIYHTYYASDCFDHRTWYPVRCRIEYFYCRLNWQHLISWEDVSSVTKKCEWITVCAFRSNTSILNESSGSVWTRMRMDIGWYPSPVSLTRCLLRHRHDNERYQTQSVEVHVQIPDDSLSGFIDFFRFCAVHIAGLNRVVRYFNVITVR